MTSSPCPVAWPFGPLSSALEPLSGVAPRDPRDSLAFHATALSRAFFLSVLCSVCVSVSFPAAQAADAPGVPGLAALRVAILDLESTYGEDYPAAIHLEALASLEGRAARSRAEERPGFERELGELRRSAFLDHPLLVQNPLLFVVRAQYRPDHHSTETLFQTSEINTGSFVGGSALKCLDLRRGGEIRTLLDLPRGIVRDPEVSFDGTRILVSLRVDASDDYHIHELRSDGSGLRQLTHGAGVSDIDPLYLPDGDIVFSSTREPKYCHCNRHIMANLFRMRPDGTGQRQIGHDILFEGHPTLLPDGRILYDRWEYVDRHFGPSFGLWTSYPDGTQHALLYGNNAWSPGAFLDARPVPGSYLISATLGSCHDRPWGAVGMIDRSLGLDGSLPVTRIWPESARRLLSTSLNLGRGADWGHPVAGQIDAFVSLSPKYEDPWPLSEDYILASRMVSGERMGIFLLDTFGNETLLHVEGAGCYDPMPLGPRPRPPVIPDRVELASREGTLYVTDVYRGSGMETLPRGTVRYLRIVEAPEKRFWSDGAWGIDATQAPAMNWNATNSKRILGDVPVEADGSASFTVPADKYIYFQALDAEKLMVQSMRSGTTVLPGEVQGCVGCHEDRQSVPHVRAVPLALRRPPSRIEPWYGPTRDFSFAREVQPVFDRYCVSCHDRGKPAGEKLILAGDLGLAFNASYVDLRRRSPLRWFPEAAGEPKALVKAVDDGPPEVLPPYAWGAHRSRLIDVVKGGHEDVQLDRESFERIATWIDMNAPYYGDYSTAYGSNTFGRSPLDGGELHRLRELTGRPLGDVQSELAGSPVSFTRPEWSPVLEGLEARDPGKYAEALALIRAGSDRLARSPRADMPGVALSGEDARRQAKYEACQKEESEGRRLVREGGAPE